jgi:BTB/POZ domain
MFSVCVRSPVFRAMLTADMRERRTGRIELTDMRRTTGLQLLSYLYNGWVEPDADMIRLIKVC